MNESDNYIRLYIRAMAEHQKFWDLTKMEMISASWMSPLIFDLFKFLKHLFA